jgi:predicted polyphosphate/ATP-dependent NAD kinase
MVRVGIIANPAAGKDVRRLVSEATIVTAPEKVALLRRVLAGIDATPVAEVLYLRDSMHLVDQALAALPQQRRPGFRLTALDLPLRHGPEDTRAAAALMASAGVQAVLVLGGDGTSRLVAAEIGDVPMLPVSTGTNNAFPHWTEATAAGLALGFVAAGHAGAAVQRRKRIELREGGSLSAIALVDAVVLRPGSSAILAVWDPDDVEEVVVAQALPETVGWSAAVGAAMPFDTLAPHGGYLRLDPAADRRLQAAIAPGLIAELGVAQMRPLAFGEPVQVFGPRAIALDGEPLWRLPPGKTASLAVVPQGPRVIEIARALELAAREGAYWLPPATS